MNLSALWSLNPRPTERRDRFVPRRTTPPTDGPQEPGEITHSWFHRRIKPSRVLPAASLLSTLRDKTRGQVPWRRD
jgi:hypothetical protein